MHISFMNREPCGVCRAAAAKFEMPPYHEGCSCVAVADVEADGISDPGKPTILKTLTLTLTLGQVREAGLPATQHRADEDFEWWDGVVYRICHCCRHEIGQYEDDDLKHTHVPPNGWHHLPDCGC